MKKLTKIIAASTAVLLTLGAAGCTKSTQLPDFINPTELTDDPNQSTERYIVNVRSEGGLPLDGVRVSAKKNGTVIKRGISRSGKIELGVALDEYELEIDGESLPAGYYLPEATYKTNPARREEVNIRIPSKVISSGSPASSFALGSIMRDITFIDTDLVSHKLSEVLTRKKAVVLNFFFTGCGPCRREFPAIEKAYQSNNEIELLAISHTSNGDNERDVADFKQENGLSFPMGIDTIGLTTAFNVANFPTTVIIDRYGLIAYRSKGTDTDEGAWRRLFNKFTAPDYVQNITGNDDPQNPSENPSGALVKPNVTMPASSEMTAAASADIQGANYSADEDEYMWPWVTGADEDGSYICSSNTGIGNSYAAVYIDIPMKEGQVLSFDYYVSSEAESEKGGDVFNVILDGDSMNGFGWSGEIGWTSADIYVSDRDKTVQLAFFYHKDAADPVLEEGEESTCKDIVKVRNIRLADSSSIEEPMDVMRPCASGEVNNFSYSYYVTPVLGADGFYHKDTADGALLYITLTNITPWSDLRGDKISDGNGSTYPATLYKISENNYFNIDNSTCIIGNTDVTETFSTYVLIQGYMPPPYYLLPVNEKLKEWADALVKDFAPSDYTQNSWLEFCFYYDHYGSADYSHHGDETCNVKVDYTEGLTTFNAYEAHVGINKANIRFPLELAHNGTYYKFTAPSAGVYQIRSYTSNWSSPEVTPGLSIRNKNGRDLRVSGEPRDVDGLGNGRDKTDPLYVAPEVNYEGFNEYIRLEANQTVYLYLEVDQGLVGYYEFEITNRGEDFSKMLVCSTGAGLWSSSLDDNRPHSYAAIRVALNDDDNCYYASDSDGEPRFDQPIYVDVIHQSYLVSERTDYNYCSLKDLVDDNFFRKNISIPQQAIAAQTYMQKLVSDALAKDKDDPLYGMIEATDDFAKYINLYYDSGNLFGGSGDGRGWLAFCVYEEFFD
ncbi:MAG: TlpA family protein disulfide reductase [Clostridia bacterium]|nr:TlpA family protein disulfide reductase [Clostridia bacterium]